MKIWTKASSDFNRSGKGMAGTRRRAQTKKWHRKYAHKVDRMTAKKIVNSDIIYWR